MASGYITIDPQFRGSLPDPEFHLALRRAVRRSGEIAFADMQRRISPHTKTGRTEAGNQIQLYGAAGFRLFNPEETALFLEFGTEAHTIEPRDAQALRFYDDGLPVFAARVDHPGTEADPFMEPAVVENAPIFEEIFAEEVEEAWRRG
jgi:hypothetical protein